MSTTNSSTLAPSTNGDAPGPSVFTEFGPESQPDLTKDSAKYSTGDTRLTYPIYALWVMLITENWEANFQTPGFEQRLYEELFQEYARANPTADLNQARLLLFGDGQPGGTVKNIGLFKTMHQRTIDNADQMNAVRSIWNDFLEDSPVNFYGGRPCPGGGTILGMANLTPSLRP